MDGQENWLDVGAAEELAALPAHAGHRDAPGSRDIVSRMACSARFRIRATMWADRWPTGAWMAITSPVPGITGNFHRCSGVGEPGFERIGFPPFRRRPRTAACSSILQQGQGAPGIRTIPNPAGRARRSGSQGPLRLAGIATSPMDADYPRFSGSDPSARSGGARGGQAQRRDAADPVERSQIPPLRGYYSKSAQACTWPCSITQMDASDQMDQVYEALVHWADAVIVASPIRWGVASSLYFKMAERLNCVQNAINDPQSVLIRNKVAGFIIVGGQDNYPGCRRPNCWVFFRAWLYLSAVPVHRTLTRLGRREDMERNSRSCDSSEGTSEGAGHARQALSRSCGSPDRSR